MYALILSRNTLRQNIIVSSPKRGFYHLILIDIDMELYRQIDR